MGIVLMFIHHTFHLLQTLAELSLHITDADGIYRYCSRPFKCHLYSHAD